MVTSRHFKIALIVALIFAASAYRGQAQPVPQAPAGNAVPVTADNFNRAETDMYFGNDRLPLIREALAHRKASAA